MLRATGDLIFGAEPKPPETAEQKQRRAFTRATRILRRDKQGTEKKLQQAKKGLARSVARQDGKPTLQKQALSIARLNQQQNNCASLEAEIEARKIDAQDSRLRDTSVELFCVNAAVSAESNSRVNPQTIQREIRRAEAIKVQASMTQEALGEYQSMLDEDGDGCEDQSLEEQAESILEEAEEAAAMSLHNKIAASVGRQQRDDIETELQARLDRLQAPKGN